MATNPTIIDAETDDDSDSVSLRDVIAESDELEETANAVLGGSDHQACTYDKGYVGRQALYACSTCSAHGVFAGICLACSLKCHDGHELFELYTKRNFRCDCGNKKFLNFTCKLKEKKDEYNDENSYNHNFKGQYCTCNRPYPDLDDSIDDEMIQCIVCEDWYHSRHLVLPGKVPTNYAEMACHLCAKKASLLKHYSMKTIQVESHEKIDVVTDNVKTENKEETSGKASIDERKDNQNGNNNPQNGDCSVEKKPMMKKMSTKDIKQERECHLNTLMFLNHQSNNKDYALFFNDNWRQNLCRCTSCKDMLEKFHIKFLYDVKDMTSFYEKSNAGNDTKSYNKGMEELGKMDRIQQVEMLSGYNEMKSKLTEYLKGLDGKVVTETDIQTFFEQLNSRKKPRLEMSYFCK